MGSIRIRPSPRWVRCASCKQAIASGNVVCHPPPERARRLSCHQPCKICDPQFQTIGHRSCKPVPARHRLRELVFHDPLAPPSNSKTLIRGTRRPPVRTIISATTAIAKDMPFTCHLRGDTNANSIGHRQNPQAAWRLFPTTTADARTQLRLAMTQRIHRMEPACSSDFP